MVDFDNGRPPVTTADGSIQSVTIDNSQFDEKEIPSIQSITIDNSDATATETPSIQSISIDNTDAIANEVFQISAICIDSQSDGRIYGGFL